jgi:hypothetical protein
MSSRAAIKPSPSLEPVISTRAIAFMLRPHCPDVQDLFGFL